MKQEKKITKWKRGGKMIVLAFLVGITLRFFVVESVYVSTPQMEKTYSKGDLLFVSKLAYGLHLPFSSLYFSIKQVRRNEIVLIKLPVSSAKFLTRCVGIPGDTVIASGNKLTINGKDALLPPTLLMTTDKGEQLSKVEWYLSEEAQGAKIPLSPTENALSYTVIVPKAGMKVSLEALKAMPLYEVILIDENAGTPVIFKNNSLYIDGKKQTSYTFKRNYYWVLSDNREEGFDSRHFGFVPEQNIQGKAMGVWMHLNLPFL